jgi:hypothetical protein
MKFAPKAYRDTRKKTIESVEQGLKLTKYLSTITPDVIKRNLAILPTLRMCTCPPLARDRLVGLADSTRNFVGCLEEGKLPQLLSPALLEEHLRKLTGILSRMLDVDIFPWLEENRRPTKEERYRSSTVVADRLCGAVAELIVRNAQEKRQLALIEKYLTDRGYKLKAPHAATPLNQMEPGTFSFRLNVFRKALEDRSKDRQDPHRCRGPAQESEAATPACAHRSEVGRGFHERQQTAQRGSYQDQLPQSDPRRSGGFCAVSVRVFRCGVSGLRGRGRNRLDMGASY